MGSKCDRGVRASSGAEGIGTPETEILKMDYYNRWHLFYRDYAILQWFELA